MITVLAIADTHCGHVAGWCPTDAAPAAVRSLHRESNAWMTRQLDEIGPVDVVLYPGDVIDGKGKRAGGREVFEQDRERQCDIAVELIKLINPRELSVAYGTPYHSGDDEQWESVFVGKCKSFCKASGGNHEFVSIDGVGFSLRHKVGGSSVPYGAQTPLMKEITWQREWERQNRRPPCQVVLRGHTHRHVYGGDCDALGMVLPAMQFARTEYGALQCSGTVDFGLVVFKIERGTYTWESRILKNAEGKIRALKLGGSR